MQELITEIRRLSLAIASAFQSADDSPPRELRDDEHGELVRLAADISDAVGDRMFSVRELLEHAGVDDVLRAGLVKAVGEFDSRTARRIGKRLQRAAGQRLNGLHVERVKCERDGAVWRIVSAARVSLPRDTR